MSNQIKILSCSNTKPLAEKIANAYGHPLAEVELQKFSDGEFQVSIKETVRGCEVFIIQSTSSPTDNLMELLLMLMGELLQPLVDCIRLMVFGVLVVFRSPRGTPNPHTFDEHLFPGALFSELRFRVYFVHILLDCW